jgi:hypothetical protein
MHYLIEEVSLRVPDTASFVATGTCQQCLDQTEPISDLFIGTIRPSYFWSYDALVEELYSIFITC